MTKLNVLQVTHDLNIGGLQKLVVDIATNIDRARFDVSVCCLREIGPFAKLLSADNIKIYEINQVVDEKINYFSFLDVRRVLKNERIDIIHTHNTNPFIDGGLAAILARTPVRIHTDHAREYPDKKRYMVAERVMSWYYDQVVAVSDQTRSNLINYEKISPNKIITIHNGVSFDERVIQRRALRKKGISEKSVIGTIGRVCAVKGYEYLIEAMSELTRNTQNFELQIIGDGEARKDLERLVEKLCLGEHVKFMGEQGDVASFYENFDIFAISSVSEGLPLVLLEAMAYGVPVVATEVGGIPGVVKNGISALTVKPRDPKSLAEAIWQLINDPDQRDSLAVNAKGIFAKQFGIGSMMSKYEELYMKHYLKHV